MKTDDFKKLNTAALAYMGDAVYDKAVREHLIKQGHEVVNVLHKKATRYVKASSQAKAIKKIFDELTPDEQILTKRARNHKYNSKAKNADPMTYKWATAFEAMVGYFYLAKEEERLQWFIQRAFAIIEEENV